MSQLEYTPRNDRAPHSSSYEAEHQAYSAFFNEYWRGSFVSAESKTDKVDSQKTENKEHPLLKGSEEPVPDDEKAHFNNLSKDELDTVRRAFDFYKIPADTPLTPKNMNAFMHNLTNRLGSDKYAERKDAMLSLSELGVTAIPALLTAKFESDDLEVKRSAEKLIQSFVSDAGRRQLQKEHEALTTHEKERKFVGLEGSVAGSTPFERLMRWQKGLVDTPDAKLSPDLARLESTIDGRKKHLLETAPKRNLNKEQAASISTRADEFKREIGAIRKMAEESSEMKDLLRLRYARDLLGQESDPNKISKATRTEAAKVLLDALKNPKILQLGNEKKTDLSVRETIQDLKHLNYPNIDQLVKRYEKVGGNLDALDKTKHRYSEN